MRAARRRRGGVFSGVALASADLGAQPSRNASCPRSSPRSRPSCLGVRRAPARTPR